MKRFVATITYDSARQQARLGTRGFSPQFRSLIYEAADVAVELVLQCSSDFHLVHGQVIDKAGYRPAGGIEVCTGDNRARTDEFGQFSIVVSGLESFMMRIQINNREISCSVPSISREAGVTQ